MIILPIKKDAICIDNRCLGFGSQRENSDKMIFRPMVSGMIVLSCWITERDAAEMDVPFQSFINQAQTNTGESYRAIEIFPSNTVAQNTSTHEMVASVPVGAMIYTRYAFGACELRELKAANDMDELDEIFADLCYEHHCDSGFSTFVKNIVISGYYDIEDSYALLCSNVFDIFCFGAHYYTNCLGVWVEGTPPIVTEELRTMGMGVVKSKPDLQSKLRISVDPANKAGTAALR